jgi:hypothetical protein
VEILVLVAVWFFLLFLTFRPPGTPRLTRLFFFLLLVGVSALLGFMFLVNVLDYDPVPDQWDLANWLTEGKMIDLRDIAPGVYHPNYINRLDTDTADGNGDPDEWLVFYQYDVVGANTEKPRGPFGAAIYEPDHCRPPAILSYELVPMHYDYLGQDSVNVTVENIIPYADPLSLDQMAMEIDRPEVIITGKTGRVTTDLNIFRKVGTYPDCLEVQDWRRENPGLACPYPRRVVFQNIGSFRGSYQVKLNGAKVTVSDRAGFERSQIVVKRVYTPKQYGNYFLYDDRGVVVEPIQLAEPDQVGLDFGPGQPDEIQQVYYPEKTVLAFFLDLGNNPDDSMSLVCGGGKGKSQYYPEDFGLTVPLKDLKRVAVCELGYVPNAQAEQLHEDRIVRARVEEVTGTEDNTCKENLRSLECTVSAAPNPKALPYGCEWCLLECHEAQW